MTSEHIHRYDLGLRQAVLATIASFLVLTFASSFAQEVKIPKLLMRATDFTNTLSREQLAALEADLARFEDTTSTQVVFVMIPTLGNEQLEDYSLRTAEANAIGQKKLSNGVLLLIAKDDRKIRIEVGYGLEGVLPDGLAGQIIRREITPEFRNGDYFAGIKAGTDAIMRATRNEYKAEKKTASDFPFFLVILIFFIIFIMIARNARRSSGLHRGGGFPMYYGGGWGGRSRDTWGSSGGSGGGGFGGFSGGGGSFGGGGASGGW